MKALVVYESMYGNTHEIATAIAEGLGSYGSVTVTPVAQATSDLVAGVDVLVVGGPTHVHGMSRSSSRQAAVETAEADETIDLDRDATGPGVRDWFKQLPKTAGTLSAAFDTRIDKPAVFTGSAAKGISKQLRSHRYRTLVDPESFFVEGSEGPLQVGEEDRARRWGAELATRYHQLESPLRPTSS